jgi:hypothetical protein
MHLMRGGWPSAGLDHLAVQLLKMLRLQPLQAVLAKAGNWARLAARRGLPRRRGPPTWPVTATAFRPSTWQATAAEMAEVTAFGLEEWVLREDDVSAAAWIQPSVQTWLPCASGATCVIRLLESHFAAAARR